MSSWVCLGALACARLTRIHFSEVFLVRERVRPELLGLLSWTLLIGTHLLLLLTHGKVILSICRLIDINIHGVTALLGRHDEARGSLAWVVDDNIVDVIQTFTNRWQANRLKSS